MSILPSDKEAYESFFSYLSKPFTVSPSTHFVQPHLTTTRLQGKELIARVHLQMQLGKRRIELEAKFEERTREIQLLSDLSPVGISRFASIQFV